MKTRLLALCAMAFVSSAHAADELNTYVMPMGTFTRHMHTTEDGNRLGGRLEFANMNKYFAVDFRFGTGNNYTDFGGSAKFFNHWRFDGYAIGVGMGLTGLYSKGPNNVTEASRQPFVDAGGSPFVRFILDRKWGVGLMIELGVDTMVLRQIQKKNDLPSDSNNTMRMRPYIGLGIPFEV